MPNVKISAMPGLGTNAAPGDLLPVVDVSAPAATANKHITLNNFLSVITRGITDHAVRFTPPGSPPSVSLAAQGAIYFDGSNFQISANGGAYAPLLSLSPQADHAVLIGPTSGGPSVPTWRGLALSDLPAIATNRLLGRVSPLSGDVEEITPGAGVLTWLQTPTSDNLRTAVTTTSTGSGSLVFATSPTITNTLKIEGTIEAGATTATVSPQIRFVGLSAGPFHSLEIRNATTGAVPLITVNSASTNYGLGIAAKGSEAVTITGTALRVLNSATTSGGIIEARGGSAAFGGGSLRMYEQTTNGTNFWAWRAPDQITVSVEQELPDGYGQQGDVLRSDGAGKLSWAPIRTILTSDTNFFVRPDGSNSNSGTANTAAGAWLTLQYAFDFVSQKIDTAGFSVTINVSNGTYTGFSVNRGWVGGGRITFVGNSVSPSSCVIAATSGSAISISASLPATVTISGFRLTNSSGNAISHTVSGADLSLLNLDFGSCTGTHIFAANGAVVNITGTTYSITGGATVHTRSFRQATISYNSVTVTLTATPNFTGSFTIADSFGSVRYFAVTFTGTATGQRFTANTFGYLAVFGASLTFLPGSVAGVVDSTTFGLYS